LFLIRGERVRVVSNEWGFPNSEDGELKQILARHMANHKGFTMISLLVSAVLSGFVSLAAMNFYQQQHSQLIQQTDASDTQQSIRATMNELTRDLRMAGYRAFGANAVEVSGGGTRILIRYHDGTAVRAKAFYLQANSYTGRTDLMVAVDKDLPATYAEGIDSVLFTAGGTGPGIQWITVSLVAKSAKAGFQSAQSYAVSKRDDHLYRRLTSKVTLRNRS
jgi:type II secretory pathway pseudopilin PulG